jgi:hypothetical protein
MAYKNGDNDSPCTSPILQLKKSEKEYNLHVNLLKTKVVIFRNRTNIKSEEKWEHF